MVDKPRYRPPETIIDVHTILTSLAQERPVFHSEADFQHAFAWLVHQTVPDYQIRLEYKPLSDERLYIDLWISTMRLAIELKYRTRKLAVSCAGEHFNLRQQSAHDQARYDFLNDVQRLERLCCGPADTGYAILLTNEHLYWSPPRHPGNVDEAFHLHHGRNLSGTLAWSPKASTGTTQSREAPINLDDTYDLAWHEYSCVSDHQRRELGSSTSNVRFRYLSVQISSKS